MRAIKEFADFTAENKLVHLPQIGLKTFNEALTWYENTYSLICNPDHPCFHADPFFPDIQPPRRAQIHGELLFFEGTLDQFTDWFEKRLHNVTKASEASGLNHEIVFTIADSYIDQTITTWPDHDINSSHTFYASYMNQGQNTSLFLHGILQGQDSP